MATIQKRESWNKGKLVGQKPPLKPKEIWAIRIHLQNKHAARDLAMFNLAIDSKLRGCDLVNLRVRDVTHGSQILPRTSVVQRKTQRPVQFVAAPRAMDHRTALSGVIPFFTSGEDMAKSTKELLLEQERFELKTKSGGGLLSYEVWGYREKGKVTVTRYNLAYVNHAMFQGDNGRVLGFDNAHGHHHRHYMGAVEPVEFTTYEETLERFQQEWQQIVKQARGRKP